MGQRVFRTDDTDKWVHYLGNGSAGAYSPSTGTDAPIDSSCTGTAGNTTLSATNASFTSGQIILIIDMRTGKCEIGVIKSYTAGTITLYYPLMNSYTNAQVIASPNYTTGTISGGVTITGKAWNGTVGGVFFKVCRGAFTNSGALTLAGLGFRRSETTNGGNGAGFTGEGTGGAGGAQSVSANGNGGGGGGYSTNGPWDQANGGGGGANLQTNGSAGITTGGGNNAGGGGGALGNSVGVTTLIDLFMGGAGGGGGRYNSGGTNGKGGNGGGIVVIIASSIDTSGGTINVNGNTGEGNVQYHSGAGGAGAGGSVLLKGIDVNYGTGKITASGGSRSYRNGSSPGDEDGGSGGDGIIHIDSVNTPTGSSTPTANTSIDAILNGFRSPMASHFNI